MADLGIVLGPALAFFPTLRFLSPFAVLFGSGARLLGSLRLVGLRFPGVDNGCTGKSL